MTTESTAGKIECLKELAAWMEKYGVEFDYTIDDDGVHVDFSGDDCGFMGDTVVIGFDREDLEKAIAQLENTKP